MLVDLYGAAWPVLHCRCAGGTGHRLLTPLWILLVKGIAGLPHCSNAPALFAGRACYLSPCSGNKVFHVGINLLSHNRFRVKEIDAKDIFVA